ncbi:hypothetical protein EF096_20260, partial [Pseudomonas neustonica]
VAAMLLHHPHGSFTDFRGKLVCLVHGFIFSGVEASAKPGAVQRRLAVTNWRAGLESFITS